MYCLYLYRDYFGSLYLKSDTYRLCLGMNHKSKICVFFILLSLSVLKLRQATERRIAALLVTYPPGIHFTEGTLCEMPLFRTWRFLADDGDFLHQVLSTL